MAETDQRSDGRVGVIDMIAHDPKTDEAVLVMNETQPLNDSDERDLVYGAGSWLGLLERTNQ